ncbi:rhomboid family intramembrane serine protease [Microscilla marina]|uniref:Rhomboid family protein n=1 Tax=Microscilla marina ATCC 23134 TaxID=313606 RepID=A1ZXZ5_MICM2|nr:rhomboid family intramembrane serine protease [Microscilla marina]EAY24732.1 rhomboid family protein [Microscilla marina ATCC 23134]
MQEEKKHLFRSMLPGLVLAGVMWLIKLLETLSGSSWSKYGLYPKEIFGIKGILTMPFLHADYAHLIANTIPLVVLLTFIHINYRESARKLPGWLIFASGLWTWSFARPSFHIGASGLVYGLISFVLFSGFIRRDRPSLALSFLVIFLYGGFIWGMLPQGGNVSWEGHLSGGIAGFIFAFAFSKPSEDETEIEDDLVAEELPLPNHVNTSSSYIYFSPPTSSQNPETPPQNFHLNYLYYEEAEPTQKTD